MKGEKSCFLCNFQEEKGLPQSPTVTECWNSSILGSLHIRITYIVLPYPLFAFLLLTELLFSTESMPHNSVGSETESSYPKPHGKHLTQAQLIRMSDPELIGKVLCLWQLPISGCQPLLVQLCEESLWRDNRISQDILMESVRTGSQSHLWKCIQGFYDMAFKDCQIFFSLIFLLVLF